MAQLADHKVGREAIKEFEMTKSRGIGRGGARPGSGRKRKAITLRLAALKNALAALLSSEVSNLREADRRFVRAMIALGATNNATAVAFGISEAELLAKFPDELECRTGETIQLLTNPNVTNWHFSDVIGRAHDVSSSSKAGLAVARRRPRRRPMANVAPVESSVFASPWENSRST